MAGGDEGTDSGQLDWDSIRHGDSGMGTNWNKGHSSCSHSPGDHKRSQRPPKWASGR